MVEHRNIISYIPHENNVYYDIYNVNVFYFISNDVDDFSKTGSVVIAGDLNSRIGNVLDYIEIDHVADLVLDIVSQVFTYDADTVMINV